MAQNLIFCRSVSGGNIREADRDVDSFSPLLPVVYSMRFLKSQVAVERVTAAMMAMGQV